jgi:hypothetical protein
MGIETRFCVGNLKGKDGLGNIGKGGAGDST